jgi:DNA-binding FadR family transcriptional regulator
MEFNAIQVDSAPGVLVDQILGRIVSGELPPGTCLPPQRTLARMLGVGLGTLREAIKVLTVMGHLEVIRGRGTFVCDAVTPSHSSRRAVTIHPQTDTKDFLQAVSLFDLLQSRDIIERGAARLAAQVACPAGIERLAKLGARMTTRPGDIDTYYRNDFDFHRRVAEATNNRAVIEMVRLLVDRIHRRLDFMNSALGIGLPLHIDNCVRSARKVIACIAAGEGELASRAMGAHLDVVRVQLDRIFFSKGRGGQEGHRSKASSLAGG